MKNRNRVFAAGALLVFLLSTLFFWKINPASALTEAWIDEAELGKMCIRQVIPSAGKLETAENTETNDGQDNKVDADKADSDVAKEDKSDQEEEKTEDVKVSGDPQVIIYHTHSTESYMPYKESNYHREAEEGTVRDVGNVLETELKKRGINVIHDKTIHDRPSYTASYGRSRETIKALMQKYPTATYVIDLHRDAAAASSTEGKKMKIGNTDVAKFSLVVGRGNQNYTELYAFAKKVSQTAESLHKGFGGPIIEKEYRFNEFVSNQAILLEVGNNKNTIEEARACAKNFAEVLAKLILGK